MILGVYLAHYYNSWSLPNCAFVAALSASSKTKFLSDSTSLGPDKLHGIQKEVRSPGSKNTDPKKTHTDHQP